MTDPDDAIHEQIAAAIEARIDRADVLVREANSLMCCNPERFGPQREIARRRTQFPQGSREREVGDT